MSLFSTLLLLVSALIPAATAPLSQGGQAAVGEQVRDFKFREFLVGSDGRRKLSEFRGQPILIVNWTDTGFGRSASDRAKKIIKSLVPQGLVVVFMDTKNRSADDIRASRMIRYPDLPARFVRNSRFPFAYEINGPPPGIALIGIDGKLLVVGSYTVYLPKAGKIAKTELKKRKSGWGEHAAARGSRALLYGKGLLAEALSHCEKALAAEPKQAELVKVRAEILAVFATRKKTIKHHKERGESSIALRKARKLREAVTGRKDWVEQMDGILADFETQEAKRELELDRKLASILKRMKKKPKKSHVKKLRKLAKEAEGMPVGQRAEDLARIAELVAK
jgi:hypothetical protein